MLPTRNSRTSEAIGDEEYEGVLARADEDFRARRTGGRMGPICLLYTSGTTGDPKGAVYSHRGAYLSALSNALTFKLDHESVYLWTLPMFHCSGWTFTWGVTAVGGTHVCLRKVEPKRIFELIDEQRNVSAYVRGTDHPEHARACARDRQEDICRSGPRSRPAARHRPRR